MDRIEKKKRQVLLVLVVVNIVPFLIMLVVLLIMMSEAAAETDSMIFFTAMSGVTLLFSVLWLTKVLKSLNGMFIVVALCATLYIARGFIFDTGRRVAGAVTGYIIGLDNDIALIMRILTLYIGYLILAAMAGFVAGLLVSWMLTMTIVAIFVAVPMVLYSKIIEERTKQKMHHAAYILTSVLTLGPVLFVGYMVIRNLSWIL